MAAALVANEAALMAEALQITSGLEPAREAVLAAFLGLCRQSPDRLPGGAKSWLEAEVRKQARRRAPKGGTPAEDVRWKRVAGEGESSGATEPAPATLLPSQREAILHTARQSAAAPTTLPTRHPRWLVPMVGAAVALIGGILLIKRSQHQPPAASSDSAAPMPAAAAVIPAANAQPTPAAAAPTPAPTAAPVPDVSLPADAFLLPLPGPPMGAEQPQPVMTTAAANARSRDKALESSPAGFLAAAAKQAQVTREADLSALPDTVTRDHVPTSAAKRLPLPLLAGANSLAWISNSVVGKRAIPPAKAVRLEELLNAFDLIPTGTTAIAKGATLTVESLSCPWKPSATLIMVRLQGAADGPRSVDAALEVDPIAISEFRLLGYSPVKGLENETLPGVLPAKTGTTLLIELEPRASASALGEIRWKVDGKDMPSLQVQRMPDAEPSNNARFATLLAAWSMWLTRDQPELIDEDLVSGLARECAASDLPKDRRDALVLMAKSLELR